ncbi:DUF1445 domain-containing protein [Candidatus Poribacteria bacterium]|nr:DUF1445 domain-containing protein [Candidatus Poribacteria bacterium]
MPEPYATASEARLAMRRGEWTGPTTYRMPGWVQCNLVALPREDAYDFLVYCQRNRDACPIVDITDPGSVEPAHAAPGADLRTDLARYRIYQNGEMATEPTDAREWWRDDLVAVLIGSSLTFDEPLRRAGVELSPDVWVLRTELPTRPAGRFSGRLIVTLRFLRPRDAIIATQLTARFPWNHGAPLHIGDPSDIGADVADPIVGEPITEPPIGRTGVFWACGVTPQQAALDARLPLMITHCPGHGFITDLRADAICQP